MLQIGQQNFYDPKPIRYGPEEFGCPVCGKTMKDAKSMYTHIRIHTGEKPYKCSVCYYCSGDRSNLSRHMKRTHGITISQLIQ